MGMYITVELAFGVPVELDEEIIDKSWEDGRAEVNYNGYDQFIAVPNATLRSYDGEAKKVVMEYVGKELWGFLDLCKEYNIDTTQIGWYLMGSYG